MKASINIEVTEREATGQCQIETTIEGPNKLTIEGLLEALAQIEKGDNEGETALLRFYTDFRLESIRKEHDNENK